MKLQRLSTIIALLIMVTIKPAFSQTFDAGISNGMAYKLELIGDGFGVPWGMTFIDDARMLITSRTGKLRRLHIETGKSGKIKGLPEIRAKGQGGLLDIKTAPDFKETGWIYFTYVKQISFLKGGETTLARAKLSNDTLYDWQDLLITKSARGKDKHFGSRIAFDDSGHVFFSIGDRGNRPNAQDLTNHAGTIIRLNLDGSIPTDNPFVNNPKALDEIWSYGHRNPQGLAYNHATNQLWSSEHGPRGGDEINLIKKGANYGWPKTSHGKEYMVPVDVGEAKTLPGIEAPIKVYIPSIAPGSLMIYQGIAFPNWQGDFFLGALKLKHINHVPVTGTGEIGLETRLMKDLDQRIRNIFEGPDGVIYFSTDNGDIYRILAT